MREARQASSEKRGRMAAPVHMCVRDLLYNQPPTDLCGRFVRRKIRELLARNPRSPRFLSPINVNRLTGSASIPAIWDTYTAQLSL